MNGSQELKSHCVTGFRVSRVLMRYLLAAFLREAAHGSS